jgi:hypothetical protein
LGVSSPFVSDSRGPVSFFLEPKDIRGHIRGSANKAINIARSEEQSTKQSKNFASAKVVQFKTLKSFQKSPVNILTPSLCAKELLSVAHGPTRRGWTSCPAGARPFWIKREACPLHDLKEVRSEEKKEQGEKHACECGNEV